MSRKRCTARTAAGKHCKRRPKKGTRCYAHPLQKPGPKKGHGGRPKIVWTDGQWKLFDAFCKAGAVMTDICDAMGHPFETIDSICKRGRPERPGPDGTTLPAQPGAIFSEYREAKRGWGRCAVFAKQLELAIAGDRTMLIWVGKQMGQSDKSEVKTHLTHEQALAELDGDDSE